MTESTWRKIDIDIEGGGLVVKNNATGFGYEFIVNGQKIDGAIYGFRLEINPDEPPSVEIKQQVFNPSDGTCLNFLPKEPLCTTTS